MNLLIFVTFIFNSTGIQSNKAKRPYDVGELGATFVACCGSAFHLFLDCRILLRDANESNVATTIIAHTERERKDGECGG